MNKLGKANIVLWIVLILAGIFVYTTYMAPSEKPIDTDVPSDLQCAITLMFKDALATTDTNVNASYIVFNGDGTFFESETAGVGTDGKDSFTGRVNADYDIWAYNTGLESVGYLAKKFSVNCGNDPKKTVTTKLVKRSGITLSLTDDPIDLDQNLTGAAGATEEMRVKWSSNVSNAGVGKPVIILETNGTNTIIDDVKITKADSAGGKYSEMICPGRKDPTITEHKLYCFQRDKNALASDGTILTYVSILMGTSGPGDEAWINATLLDTCLWLEPGYDSIDGVNFGVEDDQENDVGAVDSVSKGSWFND